MEPDGNYLPMYSIAGNHDMYKPLPVSDTPRSFYNVIRRPLELQASGARHLGFPFPLPPRPRYRQAPGGAGPLSGGTRLPALAGWIVCNLRLAKRLSSGCNWVP